MAAMLHGPRSCVESHTSPLVGLAWAGKKRGGSRWTFSIVEGGVSRTVPDGVDACARTATESVRTW